MDSLQEQLDYTGIDYKRYFKSAIRYWYLFVLSVLIAFVLGYAISKLIPRQFAATCNIVIGDDPAINNGSNYIIGGYNFNEVNPITKEIGIIRSKNLAERTLDDLNFEVSYYVLVKSKWIKRSRYGNVPFRIATEDLINYEPNEYYIKIVNVDTILIGNNELGEQPVTYAFDSIFIDGSSKFKIERTYNSSKEEFFGQEYIVKFNKGYALVGTFVNNLSVKESPASKNILSLTLTGENEEQLVIYLNTLCRKYIENDIEVRNRIAENTINYIDGQLNILTEKLQNAEDRLMQFRKQENIFNNNIGEQYRDGLSMAQEKIQENELIIQNLENLQEILDSFSLGNRNEILPNLILDENHKILVSELNQLIVERQYLLRNQHENSPEAIKNNQLIEIQLDLLRKTISKTTRQLKEKRILLAEELKTLEGDIVQMSSSERQLANLQRDFNLAENIYNTYQQKRIEAVLAKASTVSNIRVLDPARIENIRRIKPDKSNIRKISLLIGFLIPLAFIILRETLADSINSVKEVQTRISVPIVGKLYHNRSKTYMVAEQFPGAAVTESLRSLLARLELVNHGLNKQVISFTSGSSGEGKTFCAINLSILSAKSGKKTLLIGLDLRKPQLHKIIENNNEIGLSTYLVGKNKFDDIIKPTSIKNLCFVPSGPVPPNPVELIQTSEMEDFLVRARKEYDQIIIDTPPLGIVADAMIINRYTDINLFVIRLNHTRKNIINFVKEQSASHTLKGLHLVINDITDPERYGTYAKAKYGGYYYHEKQGKAKKS